jgi:CheY-like chemotaxis protein
MAYAPRILVIEDEELVRRLFEAVLSQDGYYVTAVGSGRHGLFTLRHSEFDLAIVDMSLPDSDGPDMIRQILGEFPHIKMLALSGGMGEPMRRLAQLAGAHAICPKPVAPQTLLRAVYQLIDPSCSWSGKTS